MWSLCIPSSYPRGRREPGAPEVPTHPATLPTSLPEEAVNEVKRQAMSELQKAVSDAERKAHELITTERAKMERALAEAKRQASEDALTVINQQEDSSEVGRDAMWDPHLCVPVAPRGGGSSAVRMGRKGDFGRRGHDVRLGRVILCDGVQRRMGV